MSFANFAPRLRERAIWKSKSLKIGGVGALFEVELRKFAPRLRARAIWKSKSLKHRMPGALLEVELDKICTTPARENDLEVKIVKTPGARDVFGGSKCFLRGRRRDFGTLQKYVAGTGVREGCKNVGRRGGFEEARK